MIITDKVREMLKNVVDDIKEQYNDDYENIENYTLKEFHKLIKSNTNRFRDIFKQNDIDADVTTNIVVSTNARDEITHAFCEVKFHVCLDGKPKTLTMEINFN